MAFKMPHIAVIVGLVAAGIALLFQIVAVAADGWVKAKSDGYYEDANAGLWKYCFFGQCANYPDQPDWLKATRAFGLLGLLLIAGALVVGILSMFIDNKLLPLIAGGMAGIAALCVLISFANFADKNKSLLVYAGIKFDLSYCFALTVVAFVLCIGSSVCFIFSKFIGSSSS